MITATVLAIFLVPVFFVVVRGLFKKRRSRSAPPEAKSGQGEDAHP